MALTKSEYTINRSFSESVKLLSCIAIAIGHYLGYYSSTGAHINILQKAMLAQGGMLGVALFFFLSGYGLMKSDERKHLSACEFFSRRYLKIYLPVLLSAVIWVPLSYVMGYVEYHSIFDAALSILWGWGDGILWFVRCLLLLYAEFFLYSVIRSKSKSEIIRITSLSLFAAFGFAIQYRIADFSAVSVPMFFIGVLITDSAIFRHYISKISLVSLLLVIICAICIAFRSDKLLVHSMANYIVVLLLMYTTLHYHIKLSGSIVAKWGRYSYDIYLTHNKCLTALTNTMTFMPFWLFAIVSVAVAILFNYIRKIIKT